MRLVVLVPLVPVWTRLKYLGLRGRYLSCHRYTLRLQRSLPRERHLCAPSPIILSASALERARVLVLGAGSSPASAVRTDDRASIAAASCAPSLKASNVARSVAPAAPLPGTALAAANLPEFLCALRSARSVPARALSSPSSTTSEVRPAPRADSLRGVGPRRGAFLGVNPPGDIGSGDTARGERAPSSSSSYVRRRPRLRRGSAKVGAEEIFVVRVGPPAAPEAIGRGGTSLGRASARGRIFIVRVPSPTRVRAL